MFDKNLYLLRIPVSPDANRGDHKGGKGFGHYLIGLMTMYTPVGAFIILMIFRQLGTKKAGSAK